MDKLISNKTEEEIQEIVCGLYRDGLLRQLAQDDPIDLWSFFLSEMLSDSITLLGKDGSDILIELTIHSAFASYLQGSELLNDELEIDYDKVHQIVNQLYAIYEDRYSSLAYAEEQVAEDLKMAMEFVIIHSAYYISTAEVFDFYFNSKNINWHELGGFTESEIEKLSTPFVPDDPVELKTLMQEQYNIFVARMKRKVAKIEDEDLEDPQDYESFLQEFEAMDRKQLKSFIYSLKPEITYLSPYLDKLEKKYREYHRFDSILIERDELEKYQIEELRAYYLTLQKSMVDETVYSAYLMAPFFKEMICPLEKWKKSRRPKRRVIAPFALRLFPEMKGLSILDDYVDLFNEVLVGLDEIKSEELTKAELIVRILSTNSDY